MNDPRFADLDQMQDARGAIVKVGDAVETNELQVGIIENIQYDGWANVRYPNGHREPSSPQAREGLRVAQAKRLAIIQEREELDAEERCAEQNPRSHRWSTAA